MSAVAEDEQTAAPGRRRGSILVAAGIFLSRIAGVVRQAAVNHFFGVSAIADAFTAAFKIPNLMQNLLGEGVLSASFIPVYARLLEEGKDEEAGRVAGAVAGLLAAAAGTFTIMAVLLAAPLTTLIAPGFTGPKYELTVSLMRIITPGVAVLVLSAWCLGVLNSHRRFFLSYVAPVIWNVAQIAILVGAGIVLLDDPLDPGAASMETLGTLVRALGVGTVVGGVLQFLVQIPSVLRLEPHLRPSLRRDIPGVRRVLRALGPVVAGRGVVQLSAYVDLVLASLLAAGATAALQNALLLYLLPISLFGMSIAAAELPEMSRERAGADVLAGRLDRGLSSMAFYVLPTALVFLVVGDLVIGTLFSRGAFGRPDEILVWITLAAFCLGLMASTSSRLLQSALYAIGDTRTPARAAAERVVISTRPGRAVHVPARPGRDRRRWPGAAGVAAHLLPRRRVPARVHRRAAAGRVRSGPRRRGRGVVRVPSPAGRHPRPLRRHGPQRGQPPGPAGAAGHRRRRRRRRDALPRLRLAALAGRPGRGRGDGPRVRPGRPGHRRGRGPHRDRHGRLTPVAG